jgi:molybdopterin molybdotransferase
MDGYAVRAADLPGTLPVVARIAAGRPAERPLAAGEAMEISTGGVGERDLLRRERACPREDERLRLLEREYVAHVRCIT